MPITYDNVTYLRVLEAMREKYKEMKHLTDNWEDNNGKDYWRGYFQAMNEMIAKVEDFRREADKCSHCGHRK